VPGISPSELEELLEEYYIPDDMFWVDGDDVLMAFEFDYPIFTDTELRLKLEDKMCTVNIIDDGDIVDMIFTPYGEAMKEAEALPWVLGYDFTGWYDDADCKKLHDFSKPVLEDFSLFAGWKRTQRKITFDSSGGDSVKTQTILSGDKARKPASPTKKGFEFAGWYENVMSNVSESDFKEFFEAFPEAKNQITFAGGNAYLPYDFNNEVYTNHTLTAFWNSKQTPSQSPLKSVMKAKGKKVKVKVGKARKLKKKKTIAAKKAYKITGSAGKLTFKKVNKAGKNKILVNTSTGKITLKKGLKKKTYKVKVRIKDSGNKKYASAKKTVTVKIIMKK
jgi:hypothetical protein